MKKLLIALAAASISISAFAAEKTTEVTFDSTQMKCGNEHITDGFNVKKMKHCKDFQDKKTDVVFIDDNSHKTVDCKIDHVGNLTAASCKTI